MSNILFIRELLEEVRDSQKKIEKMISDFVEEEKFKPCPKCKSRKAIYCMSRDSRTGKTQVACLDCGFSIRTSETNPIIAWNKIKR